MSEPTIRDVVRDFVPEFLGPSWGAWRAFLSATFALEMDATELEVFRACTGRTSAPDTPARESWLIVGRRGGKSRIVALIAVFLALFRTYHPAPGERGVVMVLAATRSQAKIAFGYIKALLLAHPTLAKEIVGRPTVDRIELANGIDIEIHTSSFRSLRGRTVVAAICEELAYWRTDDSANPDSEILAALRPAMATVENALLLALSSPHARRGELWTTYRKHFAKDGDRVLVWTAATRTMNAAVPEQVITDALEADEPRARAEYLAEFRRDVETFVSAETLEAARVSGRQQLGVIPGCRYLAFTDPAGGSGGDSMTLAIAHREPRGTITVDLVREQRPPFSPETTVSSFVETLKAYNVTRVKGDRYAGEFPREQFRKGGIVYDVSELSKSEIYLEMLPLLNTPGRVEILDHPRLLAQVGALERRTARGGHDSVDHPPGSHDDVANAVAGAVVNVARHGGALTNLADILTTSEDFERDEQRHDRASGDVDVGGFREFDEGDLEYERDGIERF